ncbi:hypothetical protein [Streptosporangium saharense]|uniref:hypothetical protein n=1 Tax=Streptosporangium saharense TaxID=1706840 RepID=UPI00332FA133
MRQVGRLTAMTPVAFFALAFLLAAGTLPAHRGHEPHHAKAPPAEHRVKAPGHAVRHRPRPHRPLAVLGAPHPWEAGPLAGAEPAAGLPVWAATAGSVTLTGGLLWWYGALWPRRTPQRPVNTRRSPYGYRRYPGLEL